jgi:transcriptional regulator with XRE-family HTH domain
MTGPELKTIRHRLGLSTTQLGRAFGYAGSDTTSAVTIRKYESGVRPIPPWLGRLAIMFDRHGVPPGWTDAPIKTDDETTNHGDDK